MATSALICGMISLRLMIAVEKAQVIVAGAIGQGMRSERVVAMAIGRRKVFAIKVAIAFFSRISNLMFSVEGMYQEKAIQKAISSMMNTVVVSTRVRVAVQRTRHVVKYAKQQLYIRNAARRDRSLA